LSFFALAAGVVFADKAVKSFAKMAVSLGAVLHEKDPVIRIQHDKIRFCVCFQLAFVVFSCTVCSISTVPQ
jgi:glycine/D-amino acid oxidase-like deaminating enzyme